MSDDLLPTKIIFSCKIQLFVTVKSDQNPYPQWFGSLDPDPVSWRGKKLDADP